MPINDSITNEQIKKSTEQEKENRDSEKTDTQMALLEAEGQRIRGLDSAGIDIEPSVLDDKNLIERSQRIDQAIKDAYGPDRAIKGSRFRETEKGMEKIEFPSKFSEYLARIQTHTEELSFSNLILTPKQKMGLDTTLHDVGSFFVNNILAGLNLQQFAISGEAFQEKTSPFSKIMPVDSKKKKGVYSRHFNNKVDQLVEKEGYSRSDKLPHIIAAISTAYRVYMETPGIKSSAEHIKEILEQTSGEKNIVSVPEAEALTGYFREGATLKEQVVRALPEVIGFTKAGLMFFSRNSKKLIKEAEDYLRKEKKDKNFSILNATDEDIVSASVYYANQVQRRAFSSLFHVDKPLRAMTIRRVAGNLQMLQFSKRWGEANKKIKDLKEQRFKREHAVGPPLPRQRGIDVLKQEQRAIQIAKSEKLNAIPKELITIPITEIGAAGGAIVGYEWISKEWGPLIGALGGGIFSMMGFEATMSFLKGPGKGLASLVIETVGNGIGKLDEETLEQLIVKGVISKNTAGLDSDTVKAMNDFATFVRGLPKDLRNQVYNNLKYFQKLKYDLLEVTDAQGKPIVDSSLVDATIAAASGLVPLMMMRDSLNQMSQLGLGGKLKGQKLSTSIEEFFKNDESLRKQLSSFHKLLESLYSSVDSANKIDPKFESFHNAMKNFAQAQESALSYSRIDIDSRLEELVDLLARADYLTNSQTKLQAAAIVESLLEQKFLRETVIDIDTETSMPAIREAREKLKTEDIPDFGKQAKETLALFEEGEVSRGALFEDFVKEFFDPSRHAISAEGAAESFAATATLLQSIWKARGRALFDPIDNSEVDIDVTDWFINLDQTILAGGRADTSDVFTSKLPKGKISKLKNVLAKTLIPNSAVLQAFQNITSKNNIQEVLEKNPVLRDFIRKEIFDVDKFEMESASGEKLTELDVNYDQLQRYFKKYVKTDKDLDLTSMDIFRLLKTTLEADDIDIPQNIRDISKELRLTLRPSEIQKLSSNFTRQAYGYSDKLNFVGGKLMRISEDLINTIDDTNIVLGDTLLDNAGEATKIKDQLLEAKNYWLNNVIKRYNDKDFNPIGWELGRKIGGEYKKDAVGWIDFNKIIESTDPNNVEKLIKNLKRTFGVWDENKKSYEFASSLPEGQMGPDSPIQVSQEKVKYLMNDLLARYISSSSPAAKAAETVRLGKSSVKEVQDTIKPDILSNSSLTRLADEGLLDLEDVTFYNTHVLKFLKGTKTLKEAEELLKDRIKTNAQKIKRKLDMRENAVRELIKITKSETSAIPTYDEFLSYFVTSPLSGSRYEQGVIYLTKSMDITEEAAREIFSDIIIHSLSNTSYIKDSLKSTSKPGVYMPEFDSKKFFIQTMENEENLKKIINWDGKDRYAAASKAAEYLYITNRRHVDSATGLKYTTPSGLSIESMISRAYSISRGVISPKYVATEIALINIRKSNAEALSQMLNNPNMIDAVIDILDSEGAQITSKIRKYNSYMFVNFLNSVSMGVYHDKKEKRKEQMLKLEKRRYGKN